MPSTIARRSLLALAPAVIGGALAGGAPVRAQGGGGAPEGVRAFHLPRRVFKLRDYGKENTESWLLTALVESDRDLGLKLAAVSIDYFSAGARVKHEVYDAAAIAARDHRYPAAPYNPDGRDRPNPGFWPAYFRMRFSEPAALKVDRMVMTLTVSRPGGPALDLVLDTPIQTYAQKNRLIFPFRGPGMIKASQAIDGGHRNRSGQFAYDAFGLTPDYAVLTAPDLKVNADMAGWGREILAPAAGRVVAARNDRPDQPVPGAADPKYFLPEYPDGGDTGNSVTIDHGQGEFSMIAHLQHGSVRVKTGDLVAQGQVLGRLGNSGDSSAPHLHYQLQDGPDWEFCDALPSSFTNVDQPALYRGELFTAA